MGVSLNKVQFQRFFLNNLIKDMYPEDSIIQYFVERFQHEDIQKNEKPEIKR